MLKRADDLTAQLSAPGPTTAAAEKAGGLPAETGAVGAGPEKSKAETSKKSVYIYIAALFLVVLLFTLLSYFVQQRNSSEIETLHVKNATAQQKIENLQSANLMLQEENEAGKQQIAALQSQVADLEKQIAEIRQQWQDDVKRITESDKAAYDALLEKFTAFIQENEAEGTEE